MALWTGAFDHVSTDLHLRIVDPSMAKIEDVAKTAISGDGLLTRSLAQDFLRENPQLVEIARPDIDDVNVMATAAALLELFASRLKQKSPAWTKKSARRLNPFSWSSPQRR